MAFTKIILASLLLTLLSVNIESHSKELTDGSINVALFSEMEMRGWENKSFEGETQYEIKQENQNYFLHAASMQSASALYKKMKINIEDTPYLNWSWRVDQDLPELDEKTKTGDDYAARIYVVFKTGFTPLSAKALNYVWSSNHTIDTHWPNAYTEKAIMIPLRCKLDEAGTWYHEKVNIKEDLLKHFDKTPKFIDGIAIMTDTDNSKGKASASYGDINFSKN